MSNFFEFELKVNDEKDSRKSHSLWVERYRPAKLNMFAVNMEYKKMFSKYIETNDIPHLLLYGTPGCGKSTLAGILVKNIKCDYIYINASDENGIDTIRDKVKAFVETASINDLKVVILDEFDFMTINAQSALRNMMETYSESSRFILTANYFDKIIDAIKSRCQIYNLGYPEKKFVTSYMKFILDKESIKYADDVLNEYIDKLYPDVRRLINTLQRNCIDNTLSSNMGNSINTNVEAQIMEVLTSRFSKFHKIKQIRQIIADNGITDFIRLYKYLYDNVQKYANNEEIAVIVILAEMEYQYNFVVDKEINFAACIVKILDTIKG